MIPSLKFIQLANLDFQTMLHGGGKSATKCFNIINIGIKNKKTSHTS